MLGPALGDGLGEFGAASAGEKRHRMPTRCDFRRSGLRTGGGALCSHVALLGSFDDSFASLVSRSLPRAAANPRIGVQSFPRPRFAADQIATAAADLAGCLRLTNRHRARLYRRASVEKLIAKIGVTS